MKKTGKNIVDDKEFDDYLMTGKEFKEIYRDEQERADSEELAQVKPVSSANGYEAVYEISVYISELMNNITHLENIETLKELQKIMDEVGEKMSQLRGKQLSTFAGIRIIGKDFYDRSKDIDSEWMKDYDDNQLMYFSPDAARYLEKRGPSKEDEEVRDRWKRKIKNWKKK